MFLRVVSNIKLLSISRKLLSNIQGKKISKSYLYSSLIISCLPVLYAFHNDRFQTNSMHACSPSWTRALVPLRHSMRAAKAGSLRRTSAAVTSNGRGL